MWVGTVNELESRITVQKWQLLNWFGSKLPDMHSLGDIAQFVAGKSKRE